MFAFKSEKYKGVSFHYWTESFVNYNERTGKCGKDIVVKAGYTCPAIMGKTCIGGHRFRSPLTEAQWNIARAEAEETIDRLIKRAMEINECSEKEAIKILKEC